MIQRILVVCIGNICRSPMAEGLLKQTLPNIQVSSAGLSALVGHGADPNAIQIMADAGIDISAHRAHILTEVIARDADIILVMDEPQKQQVSIQYPFVRGKTFKLAESSEQDIPDPYRQEPEIFHDVFLLIQKSVNEWTKRINSIS